MNSPFEKSLWWRRLCRTAAVEEDPEKLSEIVRDINTKLKMRQQMLRRKQDPSRVLHIASRRGRAA